MRSFPSSCDVAVIGAGPYGLAAASHLRAANGLEVRVLGRPMDFWEHQMPVGMLLRSPYVASNIADPDRALDLDAYGSANGRSRPQAGSAGPFRLVRPLVPR